MKTGLTLAMLGLLISAFSSQPHQASLLKPRLNDSITALPDNNLLVSVGANGCVVSLTYERLFRTEKDFFITAGIGLGYTEEYFLKTRNFISTALPKPYPYEYLVVPHYITGNIGKHRHYFEFGLGGTSGTPITQPYMLYPVLGYRFMPGKPARVNFRATVSLPFQKFADNKVTWFPFGLSAGMCF
jgi:hypothetical protein